MIDWQMLLSLFPKIAWYVLAMLPTRKYDKISITINCMYDVWYLVLLLRDISSSHFMTIVKVQSKLLLVNCLEIIKTSLLSCSFLCYKCIDERVTDASGLLLNGSWQGFKTLSWILVFITMYTRKDKEKNETFYDLK